MEKLSSLSASDVGKIGHPYANKMSLNFYFIPYIRINSKWIIDLNVKYKGIKLENRRKFL